MKTINLKKYYYPICKKDTFVEVPDEVADAIVEESRAEDTNDAKQHYHCYSMERLRGGPCHPDAPAGKLPSCPVLGGQAV